jgi:hypothetical protein
MGTFQPLVPILLVHEDIVYTKHLSIRQKLGDLAPGGEYDALFWPAGLAGARAKACILASRTSAKMPENQCAIHQYYQLSRISSLNIKLRSRLYRVLMKAAASKSPFLRHLKHTT